MEATVCGSREVTSPKYKLVPVGKHQSIHFSDYGETIHPGLGPAAEAEALYVRQLKMPERLAGHEGDFVIWDVGIGAAANALTVLKHTREIPSCLHFVSFDNTLEPLRFALEQSQQLNFFAGYEAVVERLLGAEHDSLNQRAEREFGVPPTAFVEFENGKQNVKWEIHVGDFPALLREAKRAFPTPHAILFDPFSPKKNPAMWTQDVFSNLFRSLDPQRPCSLATYSRSTMTRVALLLAGFFAGVGDATGTKEETTIAANMLSLIEKPLGSRWLERAQKSDSAEPLQEGIYRQSRLSPETWEKLKRHSQFS